MINSWGFELEVGDVRKSLRIPQQFGKWEYAERDIVNSLPPYKGICADPLGFNPPVGGEINLVPTSTYTEQVLKIMQLLQFLRSSGETPTVPPTSHSHIHVHVEGLENDIEKLKKLTRYIKENQKDFVETVYKYREIPGILPKANTYLKLDGGKLMPNWMCDNIVEKANNFNDFIRIQCCGKDGVSMGRPIRYAINTYCLKHTKTIEFRCFRGTDNRELLTNCFYAVAMFMYCALGDQTKFIETKATLLEYPNMQYDKELFQGWIDTKKPEQKSARKNREYIHV